MTYEVEGVLHKGVRLTATRGFRFHIYEVVTPGITRGIDNLDPMVVVSSIDAENKIIKSYLIPQDTLLQAVLLGKRDFRGYRLWVIDKDGIAEDSRSFATKLKDEISVAYSRVWQKPRFRRYKI